MANRIWKYDYKTIRCHTNKDTLRTRLKNMRGSAVASVYFYRERPIGWDVDVHIDNQKHAEKALGVKTEPMEY